MIMPILCIVGVILLFKGRKYFAILDTENRSRSAEASAWLFTISGILFTLVGFIATLNTFYVVINGYLNPEYQVIKNILSMVEKLR